MTREEAIKAWDKWRKNGHSHSAMPNSMALVIAYNALRGPTREQVEKVWRGEWERITDSYGKIEGFLCKCGTQTYSASNFCPRCGAPMTDEAVDIVMKRLEALKDGTTD